MTKKKPKYDKKYERREIAPRAQKRLEEANNFFTKEDQAAGWRRRRSFQLFKRITPEMAEDVASYLKAGVPLKPAINIIGCNPSSFYDRMKTGREHTIQGKETESAEIFQIIDTAKDEFLLSLTKLANMHAIKDPAFLKWYMKASFPQYYSDSQDINLNVNDNKADTIDITPEEAKEAYLAMLEDDNEE